MLLAVASRAFYVWEDPKVLAITDVLPGANCGGCGNAGCAAAAEAIAAGRAPVNVCVVGGFEVAQAVGEIMGQKVEVREPEFSYTTCIYGVGRADPIYTYNGASDCNAAMLLYGGSKLCPIGCIGLGSCVEACQFDALRMGEDNLPVVNLDNCVGCGACVEACPKNIVTLTSATRRILSEYVTDECTAPCMRACPTGINIRDYIREIREGRYEEAVRIIKEKCPLPLVCGYICPAPCELECRRGVVEEPVAIDLLKRFVADYEMATGKRVHPYKAPDKGIKIALVGGGAEGLTAGYYLARLGYQPTIFDAKPQLGGILRYVISEDRLPRKVLDHDIEGILEMGVEARTGTLLGRDFTLHGVLQEGYDALVLTNGGFDSHKILLTGESPFSSPVQGLYIMLDFLMRLAEGHRPDPGRHVAVIDSTPKALELARECRNLGAERVTIVSNRPLSSLPEAFAHTRALQKEGIELRSPAWVVALGGRGEGLTRMALEGTRRGGMDLEQEILEVNTMILAGARFPELVFVPADAGTEGPAGEMTWQTLETFRTFPGAKGLGLFTPPEPGRTSDSAAVVKSILSGRRLTRGLHQHFTDGAITPVEHLVCEADYILTLEGVPQIVPSQREGSHGRDTEGDTKTAWILPEERPGLDEAAARREAERCLQCGLICYKKTAIEGT